MLILMQNRVVQIDTLEAGVLLRAAFTDATANNGDDLSQQQQQQQLRLPDDPEHLAGLSCARYGGPSDEQAADMVYWQDIPSDAEHMSPLHHRLKAAGTTNSKAKTAVDNNNNNEYLTFEPDRGGFNNIRMAMETVLAMAFAMGRTLVLPPEQEFYLLKQKGSKTGGAKQRRHFSFDHFFHMEAIHKEHDGLDIIRMDEFLEKEMRNFRDTQTGRVSFPPGNRTKWDGASGQEIDKFYQWLRGVSYLTIWNPEECLAAFPAEPKDENVQQLLDLEEKLLESPPKWEDYVGNPVSVDGSTEERLRENWAGRSKLCIYNTGMQQSRFLHFPGDNKLQSRLLTHFYAFVFFQDWKQDLWMKRFMRDHVRYVDEIQCAAARIVARLRERAPVFDSFHIRRGDFQYKKTRVEANEILEQAQKKIPDETLVYIATDERNKDFFSPLKQHYDIAFLDDFHDELKGINSNYYGMIDQLVASRGRTFFGCWFSTFTVGQMLLSLRVSFCWNSFQLNPYPFFLRY